MSHKSSQHGPLAAFLVTTVAVTGYLILLHQYLLRLGPSNLLGQFLSIGIPFLLSAICYGFVVHDKSTSKLITRLRTLAAAVLAPAIAWMLYLFIGFVFLDWRL